MQPIFDAAGNPLYIYRISGYEEATWFLSPKKYSKKKLLLAIIEQLSKSFPVIDALNKESLELFGVEWHPPEERYATYIDPDELSEEKKAQYEVFYEKWYRTLPFDPLRQALEDLGFEFLESEAAASCSHCCSTAYDCTNRLRTELEREQP